MAPPSASSYALSQGPSSPSSPQNWLPPPVASSPHKPLAFRLSLPSRGRVYYPPTCTQKHLSTQKHSPTTRSSNRTTRPLLPPPTSSWRLDSPSLRFPALPRPPTNSPVSARQSPPPTSAYSPAPGPAPGSALDSAPAPAAQADSAVAPHPTSPFHPLEAPPSEAAALPLSAAPAEAAAPAAAAAAAAAATHPIPPLPPLEALSELHAVAAAPPSEAPPLGLALALEGEGGHASAAARDQDQDPALALPSTAAGCRGGNVQLDNKDIVMLQGFTWESPNVKGVWYDQVKARVGDLVGVGVTDVWLPPPTKSVDKNGYLPSQLYNLDASKYGTEQQLKSLLDSLHSAGLRAHADVVINHRCGDFQDEHGNWTIFEGGTPDDRLDWGPWAIAAGDKPYGGSGAPDTGEDYAAAPDIDHTNTRVQDELTKWMLWLKCDIGFDGWRFDFVKGYGAKFVALYVGRTEPEFAVGELWGSMRYDPSGALAYDQDSHRQQLVDWVDGTQGRSAAFDFTTKGILQEACGKTELWRLRDHANRAPGMIGYWPAKSVTFLDNHDTGPPQNHWPFPSDKVMEGYAYILTHPGVPCIFWDHIFKWGLKDKIAELVDIRKRNGVHADSPMDILAADADLYLARIAGNVVVKLGPRYDLGKLLPNPEDFQLAAYGNEYAVWERRRGTTL